MGKKLTLAIEKLAGLGDGVALSEGRKVFVPYTLAGEVVEAEMVRRTTDADFAKLLRVVTPGADRIDPVCAHFGICGGCSLQHVAPAAYTAFKEDMARAAVRKAGFDTACVAPLMAFPPAARRRVDLKVIKGRLGYYSERSHDLVDISMCPVLEPELEALVLRLKAYCASMHAIQSVQINGLDEGYDILLTGEGIASWPHADDPVIRRVSATYNGKTQTLYQSGAVTVTFGGVKVEPPAGAFLQAVRGAQDAITSLVVGAMSDAVSVLDLFCGLGTYSFPLAAHARVRAIEGEAAMVSAMRQAVQQAGKEGVIDVRRRDLFLEPVKAHDLARHDGIVINPPRTGALAQCKELAEARIPSLLMVSCNPATFARDARLLMDGGYELQRVTPVDQFTFSSHLELVAEFTSP